MASNAVPPSVTPPSPKEWPQTIKAIQGITNDSMASITCASHGFTSDDEDVTQVMYIQVARKQPINGLPGQIKSIVDVDHFTVNINTTFFPSYGGNGVISILTGQPPIEQVGSQIFNTPFQNIATTY